MTVRSKPKHFEAVLWNPPVTHPFENDLGVAIHQAMIGTPQGPVPGYILQTQTQQQPIIPGSWLIRQSGGVTIMDQHTFHLSFETVTILEGELVETL